MGSGDKKNLLEVKINNHLKDTRDERPKDKKRRGMEEKREEEATREARTPLDFLSTDREAHQLCIPVMPYNVIPCCLVFHVSLPAFFSDCLHFISALT